MKRFSLQPELQAKLDRLSARTMTAERPSKYLSTGIAEVDRLINGGIPRGAITIFAGPPSSGRTTLTISTLSRATAEGEVCAVIDANDTFDPSAASSARVQLDQLLWVRCSGEVDHALKATELVLQSGGFGVVVLDIGNLTRKQGSGIPSPVWFRFRRAIENSRTCLIVIGPQRMSTSCAAVVLDLECGGARWSGGDLSPLLGIELNIRKRKPPPEGEAVCVSSSLSYDIPD